MERRPSTRNLTAARRGLRCGCAAWVFHTEVAGKWLHSTGEALSAVSTVIPGHVVRYTHAHAHNCTHFKCCYDIKITALAKKDKKNKKKT